MRTTGLLVIVSAMLITATVFAGGKQTRGGKAAKGSCDSTVVAAALTEEQAAELSFLREEEKLARDVYLKFYELYGVKTFSNIASSEQKHTTTVLGLLEKYGVEDPAAGNAEGVFTNPDLQSLYDALIAQGQESVEEALKVGVAIEEKDISDIQAMADGFTQSDVVRVLANLLSGSENHLSAFNRALAQ